MRTTVISLFLAVATTAPAMAATPRLKAAGKIVITNDASSIKATEISGNRKKTVVEVRSTKKKPDVKRHPRVPASLAGHFDEAATQYRLDPVLLAAVARQESRFRTRAVSPVGARCVMQLMPRTARELGVKNSFDARQNIFGGAKYLRRLFNQFKGDLNLTLAAYNAGPGTVRRYRGIPPYRETRNYVRAIRRDYDRARRR